MANKKKLTIELMVENTNSLNLTEVGLIFLFAKMSEERFHELTGMDLRVETAHDAPVDFYVHKRLTAKMDDIREFNLGLEQAGVSVKSFWNERVETVMVEVNTIMEIYGALKERHEELLTKFREQDVAGLLAMEDAGL